jgi:hypothetical protein
LENKKRASVIGACREIRLAQQQRSRSASIQRGTRVHRITLMDQKPPQWTPPYYSKGVKLAMKTRLPILALLLPLAAACPASVQAASTPAALAKAFQTALDKGDFDAARKLADIDGAPAELHFFFFNMVRECSADATCSVSAVAVDDEMREQFAEHAEAPKLEGMLAVESKSKTGYGSGTMEMPYAKVGSDYKLVSIHFTPAEFAALKAKSNEYLLAEFFAKGIIPSGKTKSRADWATAANPLPADGGEPGKAFVAQTRAMAAAVDAKDPEAAMKSGGQLAEIMFSDKDFEGKPIPLADRKSKLYVQSLRMLRDVKVNGGYQLDNDAVLIIEARNGIGWVVRGPIMLVKESGSWDFAGGNTVSYLADTR